MTASTSAGQARSGRRSGEPSHDSAGSAPPWSCPQTPVPARNGEEHQTRQCRGITTRRKMSSRFSGRAETRRGPARSSGDRAPAPNPLRKGRKRQEDGGVPPAAPSAGKDMRHLPGGKGCCAPVPSRATSGTSRLRWNMALGMEALAASSAGLDRGRLDSFRELAQGPADAGQGMRPRQGAEQKPGQSASDRAQPHGQHMLPHSHRLSHPLSDPPSSFSQIRTFFASAMPIPAAQCPPLFHGAARRNSDRGTRSEIRQFRNEGVSNIVGNIRLFMNHHTVEQPEGRLVRPDHLQPCERTRPPVTQQKRRERPYGEGGPAFPAGSARLGPALLHRKGECSAVPLQKGIAHLQLNRAACLPGLKR